MPKKIAIPKRFTLLFNNDILPAAVASAAFMAGPAKGVTNMAAINRGMVVVNKPIHTMTPAAME